MTKTLEILVRVLEPGALIAGKYRMRLSRDRHFEWDTNPAFDQAHRRSGRESVSEQLRTESLLGGSAKHPCQGYREMPRLAGKPL
ncbi:MAG: hypothetical protein PVH84_02275 [Candidatus Aminicenantes bacterium]